MPHYYFHLDDGISYPDITGTKLADIAAARHEALRFAGALVSNLGGDFWDGQEWAMRVTDATGLTLFTIMLTATDAPAIPRSVRL